MVTLTMLVIISILGVSSMRRANLEQMMATNSVHRGATVQAAESAAEIALNDAGNITTAWDLGGAPHEIAVDVGYTDGRPLVTRAELRYRSIGQAVGWSTDFRTLNLAVDGYSEAPDVRASAQVRIGAKRIVPHREN